MHSINIKLKVQQLLLLFVCLTASLATALPSNAAHYHFSKCNKEQLLQVNNLVSVSSLVIEDCNISTLPNAYFIRYSNLIELKLTNSQLSYLEDYALHGLWRLKTLALTHNNLSVVKSWSNEPMNALIALDLQHNAIHTLTQQSFQRYPNLQHLNLEFNLLAHIEESVLLCMPHLKYLNLGHNQLKQIDEHSFRGISRLTQLALHYNQIAQIERDAFESNTRLRSLRLDGNQVVNLEFLHSKALTRLVDLNLSHNLLDTLEGLDWSKEHELTHLDVSFNRLKQVLERTFAGLDAVEQLNLSHNALQLIAPHSFAGLINLNCIDLSCNNLTQLPAHSWHNLTQLRHINLSHNALARIDDALFRQQPFLHTLDLAHNQLQTANFIEQLAPELNRVELTLNLSDNRYEWLNVSALAEYKRVDLAGNRWHCQWLISELLRAPQSIHFGRNYTVAASTWSAALLDVHGIDCYDEQRKRSIVVLNATRMWERQHKGEGAVPVRHGLTVAAEPTPPPLVWPRVKMDKFDSRSIIIWMLISIALALSGLRIARQLIDRRERRRRLKKLKAQLEMSKRTGAEELELVKLKTEPAPPYPTQDSLSNENRQSKDSRHVGIKL